ncbi:MAG: tetratricopeptide repeat protein [candidate division Zixibacteria bacterium]|nr:tetratricopeptide repeat protein [candidate division Zixibacteria bacterium]
MIHRITLLPVMIILLLLSSVAYAAPDTTDARNDNIAIQVLEERVKQHAEKTQIQVEGIQNEMRVRTEALEHRLDIYAGVAVFLLTLLGLIGYKTVKGWAKDRIEKMADTVFEESLTDFKGRAAELIAEETAKAEKQRREFEREAKELFGKISAGAVDRDKPEDAVVIGEISEYVEKLAQTKTKDQYTTMDWFLLGYEANQRGNSEEAIRFYTKSIKLDPSHYWSYNNRGYALDELERYEEALKDYDKAIELDPKNEVAYSNRGASLTKLGRSKEALKDYDKAIEAGPGSATAYVNRGATLGKLERYDEALKAYDKALEIDPEYIPALGNSAEVKIQIDHYDDALRLASRALDLSKSSEEKATSLYLKCIAEKLLNKSTSATEAELDRILEEEFEVKWTSDEIEGWLETAEISEEAREFIKAKTAMLKAKQKKQ